MEKGDVAQHAQVVATLPSFLTRFFGNFFYSSQSLGFFRILFPRREVFSEGRNLGPSYPQKMFWDSAHQPHAPSKNLNRTSPHVLPLKIATTLFSVVRQFFVFRPRGRQKFSGVFWILVFFSKCGCEIPRVDRLFGISSRRGNLRYPVRCPFISAIFLIAASVQPSSPLVTTNCYCDGVPQFPLNFSLFPLLLKADDFSDPSPQKKNHDRQQ